MKFPIKVKELCTPASVYLFFSIISLIASLIQNSSGFQTNVYKCGGYKATVPSVLMIFIFKFVFILFHTYVLNLICKDRNRLLAWALVLFPILLMFIFIGIIIITGQMEL